MDKKIIDAIIESHCTHSLIDDIGEAKHLRIEHVLKQYPTLDYMEISHKMDELDKKEYDTCRMSIKKRAERQADIDF